MARGQLVKPDRIDDPMVEAIFGWVTQMESAVPNHFYLEMNFPEFMKAKLGATKVLWEAGELTMEEIQHVGIAVSRANGCPYCTAAFCTILNYGLGADESYVRRFVTGGAAAAVDERTATLVRFAEKVNADPAGIRGEKSAVAALKRIAEKGARFVSRGDRSGTHARSGAPQPVRERPHPDAGRALRGAGRLPTGRR